MLTIIYMVIITCFKILKTDQNMLVRRINIPCCILKRCTNEKLNRKGGLSVNKKGKQSIACDVASCAFNDVMDNHCSLTKIRVTPKMNCATEDIDESMCASYKNRSLIDR